MFHLLGERLGKLEPGANDFRFLLGRGSLLLFFWKQ
jgi:hypothetical protein